MNLKEEKVSISTKDGVELSGILLQSTASLKAVIQFHAGTVIRKEFYLKFARFLASEGYATLIFDYRGVGDSRPKHLKGYKASISDWGQYDAPAVLNWLKKEFPGLPIHLFAHSMGGQILGLMPNWSSFDKMMVVASSSGNWNNFEKSYKRKVKWSCNLLFPIFLPLLGYAPGRFGLGDDWPKGIADDWRQNCKENSLMAEFMSRKCPDSYYQIIDRPITAWFFSDDHMATPKTLANFQRSYPNAQVDAYMVKPESCGLDSIGHFGLFKEKSKETLWVEILRVLED